MRDCSEMFVVSDDRFAAIHRSSNGMRNISRVTQGAKLSRLEFALEARYEWKDLQGQSKDLF